RPSSKEKKPADERKDVQFQLHLQAAAPAASESPIGASGAVREPAGKGRRCRRERKGERRTRRRRRSGRWIPSPWAGQTGPRARTRARTSAAGVQPRGFPRWSRVRRERARQWDGHVVGKHGDTDRPQETAAETHAP